jgi:Domain of unknown function (DUF4818)
MSLISFLVHYLLYVKSFQEIFSAVLELPQLLIVLSVCFFLHDNEVFAKRYRVNGNMMYMVMETIACLIFIEFSVWMVWGIFSQVVAHLAMKLIYRRQIDPSELFVLHAVLFVFASCFLMYSATATKMKANICECSMNAKENFLKNWNDAQAANCGYLEPKKANEKQRRRSRSKSSDQKSRKLPTQSASPKKKNCKC